MKVAHRKGDVLTAPAFGHGCNCKGAMGAGVAALVRDRFPEAHAEYVKLCRSGVFKPGVVHHAVERGVHVFNLATQEFPGPDARVEWIEASVGRALEMCESLGIPELAIPWLGCGIGGLARPLVLKALERAAESSVEASRVQLVVIELEVK